MFYAISWFLSSVLLALWSLACWGTHAAVAWAVVNAGALGSGAPAAGAILVPDWLRAWTPPGLAQELATMIASASSMLQAVLDAVPALSGAITVLAWGVWGLGTAVLVALAVGAHALIAFLKRRGAGSGAPGITVAR
ncbi:hypothetical protein SAMN05518845_111273 [Variovorax sp. YR750]|uniref:hypothetical protein n=1 Tax=unclassified Variovorax TaxID=663243 RepID=UPI000271202B|nr:MULTISPECIES: hypothetical protein [unclassified Variovorax]EJL77018.1 hypothetical protein PMI12_01988 [Variovorax sp. CF313]SEL82275.1 hypothetical protein SAMN05518845_111273 [Variovorax sp. YR750]SOD30687.1 hypothetical protein SAMN05518800_6311 [Variovorax sp. YR752]